MQTRLGSASASNAYVAKLNPSGGALVYATFLGGSGQGVFNIGPPVVAGDSATALSVDGAGNAYVTGIAYSADFPVTPGAFQTMNKAATTSGLDSPFPGYNAFVAKINSSGSALVFSTYLGGSGVKLPGGTVVYGDSPSALSVDSAGNVLVAGSADSADFPVTTGAYQTKLRAAQPVANLSMIGSNAFVAKLNSAGTNLIYSTFLGGSGSDQAYAMAIDGSGSAYIAGTTTSLDFPVTRDAFQPVNKAAVTHNAGTVFVAVLKADGRALIYSTFLGGSGNGIENGLDQQKGDIAYGLALDDDANIYVAGTTWSADFPATQGAFQTSNNAAPLKGENGFVAKLSRVVERRPPSIRRER